MNRKKHKKCLKKCLLKQYFFVSLFLKKLLQNQKDMIMPYTQTKKKLEFVLFNLFPLFMFENILRSNTAYEKKNI